VSSIYNPAPGFTITLTVLLTVTVLDVYNAPQANVPVYVFDGTTYTNYSKSANSSGEAVFTLPQGNYRFRADKISAPH
jgi:hypothetical protein